MDTRNATEGLLELRVKSRMRWYVFIALAFGLPTVWIPLVCIGILPFVTGLLLSLGFMLHPWGWLVLLNVVIAGAILFLTAHLITIFIYKTKSRQARKVLIAGGACLLIVLMFMPIWGITCHGSMDWTNAFRVSYGLATQ